MSRPQYDSSTVAARPFMARMFFAALCFTGTQDIHAKNSKLSPICCEDLQNFSQESFESKSLDGTDLFEVTHRDVADSLQNTLARHGLHADRKHIKSDSSILLEFVSGRKACVDVHPTGEIVVIVREGDVDNVFELGVQDVSLIVELVRDGIGA